MDALLTVVGALIVGLAVLGSVGVVCAYLLGWLLGSIVGHLQRVRRRRRLPYSARTYAEADAALAQEMPTWAQQVADRDR